jgi:hypothetical protein
VIAILGIMRDTDHQVPMPLRVPWPGKATGTRNDLIFLGLNPNARRPSKYFEVRLFCRFNHKSGSRQMVSPPVTGVCIGVCAVAGEKPTMVSMRNPVSPVVKGVCGVCGATRLKLLKSRFHIACQRCCKKFEAMLVENRAGSRLRLVIPLWGPEFPFTTGYKALVTLIRNRTDNSEVRLKCVEAEKRGQTCAIVGVPQRNTY